MSNKERTTSATVEDVSKQGDKPRRISIAEACRMALETSDKALQAQITYAEEEAQLWYDFKVDE